MKVSSACKLIDDQFRVTHGVMVWFQAWHMDHRPLPDDV